MPDETGFMTKSTIPLQDVLIGNTISFNSRIILNVTYFNGSRRVKDYYFSKIDIDGNEVQSRIFKGTLKISSYQKMNDALNETNYTDCTENELVADSPPIEISTIKYAELYPWNFKEVVVQKSIDSEGNVTLFKKAQRNLR